MAAAEICKNGIRVSILSEEDKVSLRLARVDSNEGESMPCDPFVLGAVLRGMTYQIASDRVFCVIRRSGSDISLEYQLHGENGHCRLSEQEYRRLIAPVVPSQVRAFLL
jgi:hypothetical protein